MTISRKGQPVMACIHSVSIDELYVIICMLPLLYPRSWFGLDALQLSPLHLNPHMVCFQYGMGNSQA